MKLLHLDSSIQGESSTSRAISAAVVTQLTAADPSLESTYVDLAIDPPAHLTLDVLADPASNKVLQSFLAADIVVIGAGMYNFTIPSQLKAWLDRIAIAGQTFRYTPEGPEGLVGSKRVIAVLARGGLYGAGSPTEALEHAETYLRDIFGFMGIVPEVIVVEGVAYGEEAKQAALTVAFEQARQIAPIAA
ncbi:NAD(P)H-dependent oxidoreductase [Sphingobium sp.]|uniref:FMN-dependent NADH-azoreductase n=1 Tax=Sphingobium sp. TaxID=1912891 RepID=UPI0028BDD7A9|nr:NAD(P)H-dependent oxidoreductase [Sphingobium sp.]